MRIAISTKPLQDGHMARGIGVYTASLIRALKKVKNTEIIEFLDVNDIPESVDLIHFTYFDPFFLTLPWRLPKPFVVTVHDMIPFVFPKEFKAGIRGAIKWQIQKWRLSRARNIITDSENSKKDIQTFVPSLKSKVQVVSLAQNDVFNEPILLPDIKRVIKAYALPERFILYVGDVNWNKNVTGILEAWHLLDVEGYLNSGEKLYLVGNAFVTDSVEKRAIQEIIETYRLDSSVIITGRVPDADLPAFLSLSQALVFPSFYEGFGLPVLEAMASGTVVVTTDKGSLSEIAGPSLLCDPLDPKSIADSLKQVFDLDPAKREAMIKEGKSWAKKFNWMRVASDTVAVYNKAINDTSL